MKNLMYAMLAYFLSGSAIVSYLVAALLVILLVVVITGILVAMDPELLKMILHYEWPQVFPYGV